MVAAKAMELPADVLQRILLFMNPRVGQSVDRVYELAALYRRDHSRAALRLIAIWRDADPAAMRTAKHAALWQDAAEHARASAVGDRALLRDGEQAAVRTTARRPTGARASAVRADSGERRQPGITAERPSGSCSHSIR